MKGNPTAIRAIRKLMAVHRLSQADMTATFGTRSRASEILSGKRGLTVEMIARLHWWHGIPFEELIAKPRRVLQIRRTDAATAREGK